jgi:hypothetical protein
MAILAPTRGLLKMNKLVIKAKKAVLKAMMDAAGEAVTQLEGELKQLLDGRGDMDLYRVMKVVEKAVAKDCEERGCLDGLRGGLHAGVLEHPLCLVA